MVSATSVYTSMPGISYSNVMVGHDKVYVPVRPSNVIYTQFDHVAGVPAKPNQEGVTVSKAQILNSLIDQLVSMKAFPKIDTSEANPLTEEQMDVLIDTFQNKLQSTLQVAQESGYGLAGATPDLGMLFTIQA